MRAVIIGAVESTRVAIGAVARSPGWELAGVLTLPGRLAARHSDFVDLAPAARAAGAALIEAADGNAPEAVEAVRALRPDIGLVIGWSQICRPPLVEAAGGRMVGYHPAPLPRLRGRAAIPWTLLLAEPITAGTLFYVDEGIDSGPILAQHFFHVAADETATSLYARHMAVLDALMTDALAAVLRGEPGRVQDERHATYAARRTEADGEIDWSRPAAEVARLIRAVTRPYPGAFTHGARGKLVCWAAEPFADSARHAAAPGQVVMLTPRGPVIMCGDGAALAVTDHDGELPRNHERLGRRP
jgi:methionyl-tRNA formyltransferase